MLYKKIKQDEKLIRNTFEGLFIFPSQSEDGFQKLIARMKALPAKRRKKKRLK